jgi:peptidoglycan/xylan/chitin deacetylase (PgdA/CDA1 family)
MTPDRLRVYITVDTETSLGGAWGNPASEPLPLDGPVFGRRGSRCYGIPLIMDILEEHGFRATFFTEVFCAYSLGYAAVEQLFRYILDRGHDPQLHLHPVYRFYRDARRGEPGREIDLMWRLSADEQAELIGEGVSLFQELSGKTPRAYRAGCYGASETTVEILKQNGVAIDSSYNMAYQGVNCGFQRQQLNAPEVIAGILEFPVTVFRVAGSPGYKPLEISAVSAGEILLVIRALREAGCRDVVLVLHSFSLLKNLGLRFDRCRPDHIVIQRLRRLCATLSELKTEVEVGVLGEIDLKRIPVPQPQIVPSVGWMRPSMRKVVQGMNRLPWV